MKVQIIDTKRRLLLPGAKPGECYVVREAGPGHFELDEVIPAPKKTKPKPSEIDGLLVSADLGRYQAYFPEIKPLTPDSAAKP